MHICTFATSKDDIQSAAQAEGVNEILLQPRNLSREGILSEESTRKLLKTARENQLKAVLVWDALFTDEKLENLISSHWDFKLFSIIRVRDIGVAGWISENFPDKKIQLIAETGANNNKEALLGWCEYFGSKLERIVISLEITEKRIIEYIKELPVPVEILGAGPLVLFYTPRKLLSHQIDKLDIKKSTNNLRVLSSSEESHNRPFPTLETTHGTMMYLNKDVFILDKISKLKDAGLNSLRIDLRHVSSQGNSAEGIKKLCKALATKDPNIKDLWPRPTCSPFFRTNKTTVQFTKLKSPLPALRDETLLGTVVAVEKEQCIAVLIDRSFSTHKKLTFLLSSGGKISPQKLPLRDLWGNPIDRCKEGDLVLAPWVKGISHGTLLCSH